VRLETRQNAIDAKEFDKATAIETILLQDGITWDKRRHAWSSLDGRCGSYPTSKMAETYGEARPLPIKRYHPSSGDLMLFCMDATETKRGVDKSWPDWVDMRRGSIDLVVANVPWGNKIGEDGDGERITRALLSRFRCSACTMVVMMSVACFKLLMEFSEDGEPSLPEDFAPPKTPPLYPEAFKTEGSEATTPTDSPTAKGTKETTDYHWTLLDHVEVGKCVIAVMNNQYGRRPNPNDYLRAT